MEKELWSLFSWIQLVFECFKSCNFKLCWHYFNFPKSYLENQMKIIFWPKDSLLMRWKHFPNWNRKLNDLKSHWNTQNDFGPDKGPDETLLWMQILWWEEPISVRCCQGSTRLWVEYRPIKIKGIFKLHGGLWKLWGGRVKVKKNIPLCSFIQQNCIVVPYSG